jgi:hypothetical protein
MDEQALLARLWTPAGDPAGSSGASGLQMGDRRDRCQSGFGRTSPLIWL